MIEQLRGHGGDDMHFLNGGAALDPADRLPMYLTDFKPEELDAETGAARERLIEGDATEADQDQGCACGFRHRPDFSGDCRNDYQSFSELEPHWKQYGIEADYVCRGGHEWVNRITLNAALAADNLTIDVPMEARRTAAREYLLNERKQLGCEMPDETPER